MPRQGFGSVSGEFWLGLETMHNLTSRGSWQLRVELGYWDNSSYFALYDSFRIGPSPGYSLHVDGFSQESTLGDSFTSHNRDQEFRTADHNPTDRFGEGTGCGGWWHRQVRNKVNSLGKQFIGGATNV